MKIDCISDLHGFHPSLNGGDLLIVAGDLTARDQEKQYHEFIGWLVKQKYDKKIFIGGNHDGFIEKNWRPSTIGNITYLKDSEITFNGLKIWGSPWTPTFYNWNFMKDRGNPIKEMWDLIPDDIDILITHGPPFGIQDPVSRPEKFAGCEELKRTIDTRLKNLKLHVFGHIHEGYGKSQVDAVTYVNCSIMDGSYRPINKPIEIHL